MKKNLWFKLGLFCTALVLVATCFITNAWAKYTKTVSATDSARVARFEISVKEGATEFEQSTSIDIFKTAFANMVQNDNENKGADGKRLIAPGSNGETTITVSNTSEVSVKFTATGTDTNSSKIPLTFKVSGDTAEYESFQAAVEAAFGTDTVLAPGAAAVSKTISWEWKYENNADGSDTTLGLAGTAEYVVTVSVTATQVQPQ